MARLRQFATGQEPSQEVGIGCARRLRRNMEEEVCQQIRICGQASSSLTQSYGQPAMIRAITLTSQLRTGLGSFKSLFRALLGLIHRLGVVQVVKSVVASCVQQPYGMLTCISTSPCGGAGEGTADLPRLVPVHNAHHAAARPRRRYGRAADT